MNNENYIDLLNKKIDILNSKIDILNKKGDLLHSHIISMICIIFVMQIALIAFEKYL